VAAATAASREAAMARAEEEEATGREAAAAAARPRILCQKCPSVLLEKKFLSPIPPTQGGVNSFWWVA